MFEHCQRRISVTIGTEMCQPPVDTLACFWIVECRKLECSEATVDGENVQIQREGPNMRPLAVSPAAAALLSRPVHDMAR